MTQDLEHLRLLAVFHYVLAALVLLLAFIPSFYLVVGIALATGKLAAEPGAASVGLFFALFAGLAIALSLAFALCLALAGRFLRRQRRYTFCLIVAGLSCLLVPFGTALGVLTIVVLVRDSVRERFGLAPSGPGMTERQRPGA